MFCYILCTFQAVLGAFYFFFISLFSSGDPKDEKSPTTCSLLRLRILQPPANVLHRAELKCPLSRRPFHYPESSLPHLAQESSFSPRALTDVGLTVFYLA